MRIKILNENSFGNLKYSVFSFPTSSDQFINFTIVDGAGIPVAFTIKLEILTQKFQRDLSLLTTKFQKDLNELGE
jgi:hypothetical protein